MLKDALLEGYTTDSLENMPYSSLEQAAAMDPIVDQVREAVDVSTYGSLWDILLLAHPGMKKSQVHMIGERDPVQAQRAAKQLCGQVPMKFDYISNDRSMKHHPHLQRVLSATFIFTYTFAMLVLNLFLDAGKSEPQRWIRNQSAITHVGVERQRVQHVCMKPKVCFKPKVLSLVCNNSTLYK